MAMTPDERRAIIGCVFVSACILFAPGEFRAGGFLVAVTAVLTVRHFVLTKREAGPKPPVGPAPPPVSGPEKDDPPAISG